MKTLEMTIEGTRPMLLHNSERLLNPFDPTNKDKANITAKRTKQTDEDRITVARLEWTMGWYWDDQLGPVMPTHCIYASMLRAAQKTRNGTEFKDGVDEATEDGVAILHYEGPRDLDGLWGKGLEGSPFVDYRPVGQQRVKIMRCRPKLHEWVCTSRWNVDEDILDLDDFARFADKAGAYLGLGDYRLKFGRFKIAKLEVTD